MKIAIAAIGFLFACATSVQAWEHLVARDGTEVYGNISEKELVIVDRQGIEVAIPRASILHLESEGEELRATIKDGSVVTGVLQNKVEIEDGLVKRRFAMSDIESVEFDRFIPVKAGKTYSSCPIRVELDAEKSLYGDNSVSSYPFSREVDCNGMRINSIVIERKKKLKAGGYAAVSAQINLAVPSGEDQLADFSVQLVQGEKVITGKSVRLKVDEGETSLAELAVTVAADKLDPNGPPPKYRVQVVSQDAKEKVERGTFFWWFTFHIPIG